jgi:hypothetical protein
LYDYRFFIMRVARLARSRNGTHQAAGRRGGPHDDLAAALKDITDEDGDPAPIPAGRVPLSWLFNRRVAHARIMGDLDLSAATGPHRELTRAIA